MNTPARLARKYSALFILFFLGVAVGVEASPAASIPEQLKALLSEPAHQIDLTETLLLVSKHWDSSIDSPALRNELDQLTATVRQRLGHNPSAETTVQVLREVIHKVYGYRYTDSVDAQGIPVRPSEIFLHGLLEGKQGYCMNLSLLYLIIGDRLGLPLHGVPLPNHFFVRYQSASHKINIETTQGGATFPDNYYRQRFGVPPQSTYFLQNLNKKQTLGAYFSNVGMTHYKSARRQDAEFYLKQSVEINPQSIDALNNLANIYSEMKQFDLAIKTYQQALQADPRNMSTLFNLGLALSESGKHEKSIAAFLQTAQLNPAFVPVHDVLSRLYMEQKNYAGALLHLKIMSELQPGQFGLLINIGTVYLEMGVWKLALQQFQEVQHRFPTRVEVNERLAETYYRMEDFDKAIVQFEYLIAKHPAVLENYVQLGWTHYRQGKIDQAIEWTANGLATAQEETSIQPLAYMNLGLYQALKKQFSIAEKWYRKVLDQKNPKAVASMVADLNGASQNYPDDDELLYFAGWILIEGGQAGKGRVWLQRYLNRQPKGALGDQARRLLDQTKDEAATENMIEIPKGNFIMGSNDHGQDEFPEHKVYLDTFHIDKYEITAAEFAEFLNAVELHKKYFFLTPFGTVVFNKTFRAREGFESHPVNNVAWYGAREFCRWKNKRLPTEAEWEKAARGRDGFIFPWGNARLSSDRVRYNQAWTDETGPHVMVPVDSMPEGQSPFGVYHLLGNVKEWVDDWYDREYYEDKSHKMNPKGRVGGEFKVLKGGSWRDLRSFVYASFRNNSYPGTPLEDYGFRCAFGGSGIPAPKKFIQRESEQIPLKIIKTQAEYPGP